MENNILQNAIEAIRKIETQDDLNTLTKHWNMQMKHIGEKMSRGLKLGDVVRWEYKGFISEGVISKINKRTVDLVNRDANPFGRTTTRINKSMLVDA